MKFLKVSLLICLFITVPSCAITIDPLYKPYLKATGCCIPMLVFAACASDKKQTGIALANFVAGYVSSFLVDLQDQSMLHSIVGSANVGAAVSTTSSYKAASDFVKNPVIHLCCYYLGRIAGNFVVTPETENAQQSYPENSDVTQ